MNKILAVDDDKPMIDFYYALFSEAGYEIKTAPDADAAIELYHDFKPDLIVLDAEMPGGGGEKVFRLVRTILGSDIPVIFVTGLPDRIIDFALTQTQVRVFQKPVKAGELLLAVEGLLKPRH